MAFVNLRTLSSKLQQNLESIGAKQTLDGKPGLSSDDIIIAYKKRDSRIDEKFKDVIRDLFVEIDTFAPDAGDEMMLDIQKRELGLARGLVIRRCNTSRIVGGEILTSLGVDISDLSTKWHPNLKFRRASEGLQVTYEECHGNPKKTEVKTTTIKFSGLKQLKIEKRPYTPVVWELKTVYQNGEEKPVAILFIDDGALTSTDYFRKPNE